MRMVTLSRNYSKSPEKPSLYQTLRFMFGFWYITLYIRPMRKPDTYTVTSAATGNRLGFYAEIQIIVGIVYTVLYTDPATD